MGLFSDKHYHDHDNSVNINFPSTLKVNEYKAPTDESIRLLNEMQEKAIENIIAKIPVKDNLVDGEIYVMDMLKTTAKADFKIICKFKINGQDFIVEKDIDRWELSNTQIVDKFNNHVLDYGKSVMLWFALKQLTVVAYRQILNQEPPTYVLKNFMEK